MALGAADELKLRVRADLTAAMRQKDSATVSALRTILGMIDNAEAVDIGGLHDRYELKPFGDPSSEIPRRRLSTAELHSLFEAEVAARLSAADDFASGGRNDRASALRAEAGLLRRYLAG